RPAARRRSVERATRSSDGVAEQGPPRGLRQGAAARALGRDETAGGAGPSARLPTGRAARGRAVRLPRRPVARDPPARARAGLVGDQEYLRLRDTQRSRGGL